jgi:hypothetical protein
MSELYATGDAGEPTYYTIVGTQIRLDRSPSAEVEIAYYAPFTA